MSRPDPPRAAPPRDALALALDDLGAIPDPARGLADRPPPPPPAPPAEPSPTRAARRARLAIAVVLALAWVATVVIGAGARPSLGDPRVVGLLAFWAIVAALALALTLRPGARGLPPPARFVQALIAALPAVYLASVLLGTTSAEAVPLTWATASPCLRFSLLLAAGPLGLAALVLQRSFLTAPLWRGAAVGAACGMAATTGVFAHCALEVTSHLVVSHGLVILVGTLAGAALGAARGRT